jgi:predicted signal transduction protein with EAL and GGDEF domain
MAATVSDLAKIFEEDFFEHGQSGEYVLLIESDLGAATLIRGALAEAKDGAFFVDRVENLSAGIERLGDDFGTGYSSLSYLRQFPIDTLKIDQSFVRDIDADHGNNTIVSAVIRMCNSLNLRVSAEGVETPEQLAFLQAEHCEEGQGFYFSAPIDAGAFAELRGTANTKYPVN